MNEPKAGPEVTSKQSEYRPDAAALGQGAEQSTKERVRALLHPLPATCNAYRELARETRHTAAALQRVIRDRPTNVPDFHLTAPSPSLSGPVPDDLEHEYYYLSDGFTVFSAREEIPRLATALERVAEALQFEAEFLETCFGEAAPGEAANLRAREPTSEAERASQGASVRTTNGYPYLQSEKTAPQDEEGDDASRH